jgi:hypothetical protein
MDGVAAFAGINELEKGAMVEILKTVPYRTPGSCLSILCYAMYTLNNGRFSKRFRPISNKNVSRCDPCNGT